MHMVRQTLQMMKINIPISIAMTIFIMPEILSGTVLPFDTGLLRVYHQIEMEVQVYACSRG